MTVLTIEVSVEMKEDSLIDIRERVLDNIDTYLDKLQDRGEIESYETSWEVDES
jgi:hypothetical protein